MPMGKNDQEDNPVMIKTELRRNLSKQQELLVAAIEGGDKRQFEKLGGVNNSDMNFEITSDGIFPLLLASAKGE